MFEKLKTAASEATEKIRSAASELGDAAREKALSVIDGWVEILPRIELLGLEIRSFGLTVGLNPCLEVELEGSAGAMTTDRIDEILAENADSSYIKWIFQAVRTTTGLHNRANASAIEPLLVKIRVKLSPEITVFIGRPFLT